LTGDEEVIGSELPSRFESFLLGQLADQRRHRRIVISLPVRFMANDASEHRGLLFDMSPGGVSVTAEIKPPLGSHAILYIDDIGRVEGVVARHHPYGFAVRLTTTQSRRDKIAERLVFHANKHRLRAEDLRAHERTETDQNVRCMMPDGQEMPCRVIDLSLTGAAIAMNPPPAIGAELVIGRMQGRVVRRIPEGVAIRFMTPVLSHASLTERLSRR
jgi:hypothetical protein